MDKRIEAEENTHCIIYIKSNFFFYLCRMSSGDKESLNKFLKFLLIDFVKGITKGYVALRIFSPLKKVLVCSVRCMASC